MTSVFENVEVGPQIEVFQLNSSYLKDAFPQKVNLGVGGEFMHLVILLQIYYVYRNVVFRASPGIFHFLHIAVT